MFTDTIQRWCEAIKDAVTQRNINYMMRAIGNTDSSMMITAAGLVIKGASQKVAKTGASITYYLANGILGSIAAATDMAALSGTVVNATYNVFCLFVDQFGNFTSAMGTAGSSLGGITFPQIPEKKTCIGFIIIHPTGTGNFVGGTTNLDDATVVPNAVYVSLTGGFDPNILLG